MEHRRLATLCQTDSLPPVNFQKFASYLFAVAIAGLLVIGCDSTGSSSEKPSNPPGEDDGAVSFSLVRTANSTLPGEADSAFVRVWQPNGSVNLVQQVEIPEAGQQTDVAFSAPSGTGYHAGVIATVGVTNNEELESPRAMGTSGSFEVTSGDTTQASLDLRVTGMTVEFPQSIAPGITDTMEATLEMNAFGIDETLRARKGQTSGFNYSQDGETLNEIGSKIEGDSTVTQAFEVSTSSTSQDTVYVKVQASYKSVNSAWTEGTGNSLWYAYFPKPNDLTSHEEGPSFKIPVESDGDGNGTVIVTFSREEDGWEKTRRIVE